MIPTRIEGCTRVLGAPVGWTPETSGPCVGLPVRDEMNGDMPCMVSSWEPTPAELRAIAVGGKVYLRVLGGGHPPVMLFAADVSCLAPAAADALDRSIAELEAFERDGTMLSEVENEVSFIESIALCLHELKRLRATPQPVSGDAVREALSKSCSIMISHCSVRLGFRTTEDANDFADIHVATLAKHGGAEG